MVELVPRIQIEIQGRPDRGEFVPLRTFARATDSLIDLLSQVAADKSQRVEVEWFVSRLETGSTILEAEGRARVADDGEAAREIIQATVEALARLESGDDVRGVLSYPALDKARVLANLHNDGAGGIVVRGSGKEVPITTHAAERAKALLARRFHSFGSVEGTVETISIHESRPYFNIFHALDGYAIKCRCSDELLLQAKDFLGARVRVIGAIERRFDGRAESIDATDFHVFPRRDRLPQVSEIRGILADTGSSTPHDRRRGGHG